MIAIGDPQPTHTVKLGWAEAEAEAIAALARLHKRTKSECIIGNAATFKKVRTVLEALSSKPSGAWVHVASHGHADPTDPGNCYILLSSDERLTLAELQRQRLLTGLRGFVASGCVTGLGDLEHAPDELGSFAAGILQAGAPCAIATLWSVSDKATFLLMVRFMYELLQGHEMTPAQSLRAAVHWLRTATREQLSELARSGLKGLRSESVRSITPHDALRGDFAPLGGTEMATVDTVRMGLKEALPKLARAGHLHVQTDTPYAHPIYWAGAIIYGV